MSDTRVQAQLAPHPRPTAEEDPSARVRGTGAGALPRARVVRVRRLPRWPRRVLALLLAVALLGAGGVAGWWFTRVPRVAVPDVTGQDITVANNLLQGEGFRTSFAPAADSGGAAQNAVLRTDPPPGTSVARGELVTITFSTGSDGRVVPALAGLSEAEAREALAEAGLEAGDRVEELSADVAAGRVVRSEPAGGEELAEGQRVALVVSSGAPPVILPRVVDFTEAGARTELRRSGLEVQVLRVRSREVPAGRVVSQSPEAGLPIRSGDIVTVTVSTGP
jgi:serine/threonine-protein kinase